MMNQKIESKIDRDCLDKPVTEVIADMLVTDAQDRATWHRLLREGVLSEQYLVQPPARVSLAGYFPRQVVETLARDDIFLVADLARCSERELLKMPNIGIKTVRRLRRLSEAFGLPLKDEEIIPGYDHIAGMISENV